MKVAIVQIPPIWNDIDKSIEKMGDILLTSKEKGADLVVFGENWLCGYPAWLDHCQDVGRWDSKPIKEVWSTMYRNALDVKGSSFQRVAKKVAQADLYVVLGCNELIRGGKGNGTLYNTVLTLGPSGSILNHHRKLIPTYTERLVHGQGDGYGLKAVDTPFGRVGALICWEHWMPMARQTMHDQGETVHIALWPSVRERHLLASRSYAFEGRTHVIAVGQMLLKEDCPLPIAPDAQMPEGKWMLEGGSCLIGPDGALLTDPAFGIEEIIIVELNLEEAVGEKMNLAVSGHYQRDDVFVLSVNKARSRL